MRRLLLPCLAAALVVVPAAGQRRSYRLPSVDLKQPVIWGSTCEAPSGIALSFGGEDQTADDGRAHTRLRVDGRWESLHGELIKANRLQRHHDAVWKLRETWKDALAVGRRLYLRGLPTEETRRQVGAEMVPLMRRVVDGIGTLRSDVATTHALPAYEAGQWERAGTLLHQAEKDARALTTAVGERLDADLLARMRPVQETLEKAAEWLGAEPPPRALSPLAFDAKTGLFVLFGGDHCDYLTADTWVFDPKARRWQQRHPEQVPPPRANHKLRASGDGTITLTDGYTYTSNTDYVGGQYRDSGDGEWIYDIAKNTWTGKGKPGAADARVYRTGPFLPEFFLGGPRPDAAAVAPRLADLPANTWRAMNPPRLPQMNRDWGSAVLDLDRDLILRWSGGHSAHGGTDVLHYHLGSNRWELSAPVEFPLGQLYTNTEYPEGVNFQRRPWMTAHTYQSYAYERGLKKMLFVGKRAHWHVYDPDRADWGERFPKPKAMSHDGCYFTLTCTPTPAGVVCWTHDGRLFRFDTRRRGWDELRLRGKLPGSVVDNSTVVHDSKRDRLLFFRKPYGDRVRYDGTLHAVDLKTLEVTTLRPKGITGAADIPYLCQIRYDPEHDLLLVGGTLPPGPDGVRRTPAYDAAANRWVSLKLSGDDPNGKSGRNVSLGLMHDAKRKLFWAVDARSQVFVLRLDPMTADVRSLAE